MCMYMSYLCFLLEEQHWLANHHGSNPRRAEDFNKKLLSVLRASDSEGIWRDATLKQIKENLGPAKKCRDERRNQRSLFPLISKLVHVLSSFPLIFPPSSSPLPHFPSTHPSILLLLFLVHLWPWRPPQETHQLCLGLQPSRFTSVYSTAVHVRVWQHYGLYISTLSRATCTRVIAAKIVCISLCFVETGHPRGNTSISWPDSGNRPKQTQSHSL